MNSQTAGADVHVPFGGVKGSGWEAARARARRDRVLHGHGHGLPGRTHLADRTLVTGALGCLGAWTVRALLEQGDEPVGYDLGTDTHRLRLVLGEQRLRDVTLVHGDVTDEEALGRTLDDHRVTRVVHLARCRFRSAAPTLRSERGSTCSAPCRCSRRCGHGATAFPGIAQCQLGSRALASPTPPRPPSPAALHADDALRRLPARQRRHRASSGRTTASRRSGSGRTSSTAPAATGMTSGPSLACRPPRAAKDSRSGFGGQARYDFAPDVARPLRAPRMR